MGQMDRTPEGAQIGISQKVINEAPRMICKRCGRGLFIQAFDIRVISALLNPTGHEIFVPRQLGWWCLKCKKIVRHLIPEGGNKNETP